MKLLRTVVFGAAAGIALTAAAATANADGYRGSLKDEGRPFSWTGFYIGIQAGYAWGDVDARSGPFPGAFDQAYSYSPQGPIFGGHAGFNWQAGSIVFGAEADIETTGIRRFARLSPPDGGRLARISSRTDRHRVWALVVLRNGRAGRGPYHPYQGDSAWQCAFCDRQRHTDGLDRWRWCRKRRLQKCILAS